MSWSARLEELTTKYGLPWAVGSVLVATAAFMPFRSLLAGEQWGWAYLLVVALVAGSSRTWLAILSAAVAFLAWNFMFIRPYYTLHVNDSGDVIHLIAFLVVAVVVGTQTGRLRQSIAAERRQALRTAALYRLSSDMVRGITPEEMVVRTDDEVKRVLDAHGAAIYTRPPTDDALLSPLPGPSARLIDSAAFLTAQHAQSVESTGALVGAGSTFLPLASAAGAEGVLQIVGADDLRGDDRLFAESVAHLVAVYLQARRISEVAISASAAQETEKLRSALVSSVSHELKTPVASLTASVSDLISRADALDTPERREVLDAMAEDLNRLDTSIGNLLDASRLEAHAWEPKPTTFEIGELVGFVASQLGRDLRARLEFEVPPGVPLVRADFVQVSRALRHLVDNALRYSTGPVLIGADGTDVGVVRTWVADSGPGIPHAEAARIFERFYRGSAGLTSRSSTGLGLFLAQEIVSANGGRIHLEDVSPTGARFVMTLPAASPSRPANLISIEESA